MMEQLVIILIVVVVLVILDGLRRRWMERRDRVVLKLDRKGVPSADIDDDELFRSELPNGGARTVTRQGDPVRPAKAAPKLKSLQQQRTQVKPGHVPVLLETVDLEEERIEHTNVYADTSSEAPRDPQSTLEDAPIDAVVESLTGADEEATMGKYEESIDDYLQALDEDLPDETLQQGRKGAADDDLDEGQEAAWEDEDWDDDEAWDDEADDEDDRSGKESEGDESWDETWEDDWEDDEDDELDDEGEDDEDGDYDEYEDDEDEEDEEVFPDPYDDYEDDPYSADAGAPPAGTGQGRGRGQDARRSGRQRGHDADRVEPTLGSMVPGRDFQGELFQETEEAGAGRGKRVAPAATANPAPDEAASDTPGDTGSAVAADLQEVLIINVMARPGRMFSGRDLLPLLQAQGMQLGDMSIFHKHVGRDATSAVQYSMANMVKPGTFDLAGMDSFTTPGVSLFMQLPNKAGNMQAFDNMLGTARALQEGLDGELKDEQRSVFTRQTIEHSRQRIRDFELKLLARK